MVEEVPIAIGRKWVYGKLTNFIKQDRIRRLVRVVEGARLESVYTGNRIEGSNPSVSAMNENEKFFVYILQSKKDFSFYVGQCEDLDKRMSKHFDGFSKYTASKGPWRLVYFEMVSSRSAAIKKEKDIKSKKSRKYIQGLIDQWKHQYQETCPGG